ncbi:MAG: starch-binding protein [Paludibacteraceae bacterium]|nr:starch-binding protein [Paludibacteraceae bacterium]
MKNFTNNFKQFTLRLSARWLIMALMLLLGTSSAWATRVYYVNTNGWSNINCFAWEKSSDTDEKGWPGTDITANKCSFQVAGYDVYYYETQKTKSDYCIFNNGSSQTADLEIANCTNVKDYLSNYAWMFYITQSYGGTLCLKADNNSVGNSSQISSGKAYVVVTKSEVLDKTLTVSNNCGGWNGAGDKKGGVEVGTEKVHPGCSYEAAGSSSITKASTLSSLSIASSISKSNASAVSVTAKSSSANSSYGNALKAQYFVDNTFVAESANLSTSGTTTTLDLSSFADGEHTLSVILTDGTISYPDAKTATFTIISCTKSVSGGTGRYSNGKITLSAEFNTCGSAYIGFQWKEKGNVWCYEDKNTNPCFIPLGEQSKENETATKTVSKSGGTYVFRPYIVDGSDATKWIYGDDFEVITCSDPSAGYSISNENASVDWDGTEKEVIITTVNGYATPSKIYYEGNETKPTAVGEYTITIDVPSNGTYCPATGLEIGTFEILCATATSANFTISNTTFTYNEKKQTPTIIPGTGVGAATTTYKQGDTTVESPTNAGTYDIYVTTEAGTGYCAITDPMKIGDFTIDRKDVSKEDYTMSPVEFTYNGEKQVPIINPESGVGIVRSTEYKLNNTTVVENPTDAGTYTVYITSDAGTNYTAASSLELGTFTIAKKAPSKTDFSYVAEKDYTGSALSAEVEWIQNTGSGNIYTYYKVNGAADNTYTTAEPTAAGTYIVAVTTDADVNYAAATAKIELGEFVINCPSVAAPDITTSATICAGTQVTLSAYNNSNTVKWYSNSACTEEVTEQVTPTNGKVYYAKAYDEASGCYSSQYSTLTFTVNALPTISISGNEKAVFYEDVTLTANATQGATVKWYEGVVEKATGATYVVTSATEPSKTVTAKAFLNGCESAEPASHTVNFEAEGECETGRTKIYFRKSYTTKEYYHFNINDGVYLYAWNSYTNAKYTGEYPGTEIEKTENINGTEYYVYEFTEAQSTENLKIIVRATYDYCSNNYCEIGKTRDIALDVPGATYTLELANGDTNKVKQAETEHKKGDSNTNYDVYLFDVNKNSTGGGITITAPAVKTVSVTSDEDGNVTMVGQVVKTGCDTQAILGLQYKKQKQDGTYDDNYTTYPNPGTKEAISAGKTFSVTTKLEDCTYLVRARIDNSHATNGYGEDIKVVVNTTKTPISNVTLNYCDENGGSVGVDPNPMCKGATAYVKLSYEGSNYSDIKWLVEGVETNLVTDKGNGVVWSYIIQGTGQLSVELRNDANKDNEGNPTWATSDKLSFTMKAEPAAPYISIDPASGIICEGSEATIKVENPSKACSYKLVEEEDTKAGFKKYESGDLKYSVGSVGKYYVAAKHIECSTNEYTSNQVAINQIIRTSAKISIEPNDPKTTPWEPVTITVKPDAGYTYELTYTDGNLAAVDGVIIKQNGDSYTYYIPRPWSTGDSDPVRTPINYGIKAQLKVDGEASECKLKDATATIQLKDEDNENCSK